MIPRPIAETENVHAWGVHPVVTSEGMVMRYRADCSCGTVFPIRDTKRQAAEEALAHAQSQR